MRIALNRVGRFWPLAILIAFLCTPLAQAEQPASQASDKPENTVYRLYHDYAWQAIGGAEAFGSEAVNLRRQSQAELEKYFESRLVELIRKARECEEKTTRACTPDFDYIFGSHGRSATDLEISRASEKGVVQATFKDAVTYQVYTLNYEMVKTAAGWRIGDIHYSNRKISLRDALLKAAPGKPLAHAEPSGQTADTPEGTVRRLYRDYAWEGVGVDISDGGQATLQGQTLPELKKYFDDGLARLLRADRDCIERTHEICNLDHIIIFASQDPAAMDLSISPPNEKNQVLVTFKYPSNNELLRLRYDMVKTADGWRIHDIYDLNMKYYLRAGLKP